jgi:cytochrome c
MRWFLVVLVLCLVTTSALAYTAKQADNGAKIFKKNCAVCHGPEGHGGTVPTKFPQYAGMQAPPVAGPGALPGLKTAGDVYRFITKNMPLNKPGSLSGKDYVDIVAFDLKANNVAKPDNKTLTPADMDKIQLTPAGGAQAP